VIKIKSSYTRVKDTLFSQKKTLNIKGMLYPLDKPRIMGVINVTSDSFYSASRIRKEKELLQAAEQMLNDGADFIDIGGYSSRPGADHISVEEEQARVLPSIQSILNHFPNALISVDTFRSTIARQVSEEGAVMINDISGGQMDHKMFETIADIRIPYVLMHMIGDPQTMDSLTHYDNLFKEMGLYFNERVSKLNALGVSDIILDPGFGFSKSLDQNYDLLENFTYFEVLGYPLLVGISRKSMIFKLLEVQPSEALNGTTVLNTIALINRASILRVHDVKEAKQIIKIAEKLEL
jgi:dihydropteroate synthase